MSGVLRSRRVVRSRHRLASDGLNHVLIFTTVQLYQLMFDYNQADRAYRPNGRWGDNRIRSNGITLAQTHDMISRLENGYRQNPRIYLKAFTKCIHHSDSSPTIYAKALNLLLLHQFYQLRITMKFRDNLRIHETPTKDIEIPMSSDRHPPQLTCGRCGYKAPTSFSLRSHGNEKHMRYSPSEVKWDCQSLIRKLFRLLANYMEIQRCGWDGRCASQHKSGGEKRNNPKHKQ